MQSELKFEKFLNHSINDVWNAISKGEAISEWWSKADFKPETGYEYKVQFPSNPNWDGIIFGKVLEVKPPHRLVYTFNNAGKFGVNYDMNVIWQLEEKNGGTLLTLIHQDFDKLPADVQKHLESINGGWTHFLNVLEEYMSKVHAS